MVNRNEKLRTVPMLLLIHRTGEVPRESIYSYMANMPWFHPRGGKVRDSPGNLPVRTPLGVKTQFICVP